MNNLALTKKRIKKAERLHAAQLATFKKGSDEDRDGCCQDSREGSEGEAEGNSQGRRGG